MADDSIATNSSDNDAAAFCLSGASTRFESRAASIFSALETPDEKKARDKQGVNGSDSCLMPPPCYSRNDRRRKFSPQKRERGHTRYRHSIADHVVHPERWKKYSLEDTDLTSDSQNKQAAFAFITELKKRKACPDDDASEVADFRPKFKKPKRKEDAVKDVGTRKESSVVTVSGKRIQNEYVVGQKRAKDIRRVEGRVESEKVGKGRTLLLSHLEEDEEENSGGD